ncbi:hypothetical protein PCL1606_50940 [Pseudomonas chlororaphis]|uniref:Uncharacterized protein n=1 Tax=Pseudomonas chlororaphis TaxID=587753 RepID=A0A0D5Y5F5_9PSED|nr:hypothetical protein PCL1606_50940 [Pseudomonas chlororaphis]
MRRPCRRHRWQASSYSQHPTGRSRLAGEEARQPCIAHAGAIAGKPAPT